MSRYIVAGGAGFIGSHLCGRLLDQGAEVICIDNLITGSENNIAEFYENRNFIFINQDIIKGVPNLPGKATAVFHLASPASPNLKSPKSYINHPVETLMVNSLGTKHLLDFARESGAAFLYASSSEIYGDPKVSPQREDYFGNVNPSGVRSVYDEGKRFGESLCMTYFRKYGGDIRIIRIFNTYGEKMQKDDGRVVSNFINQALTESPITIYGDGKQTRSFCYVRDMVIGILSAMKPSARGLIVNLGNPDEHTIIDLAKKIKKITNSKSPIVHEDSPPDDPHQRKPDITLAREVLNFDPKITLDVGLKKTIEYFKGII
jgi:nucleoside-diphosphate-sugar epimerase